METITAKQEGEIKTTAEMLIEAINKMTPEQQMNAWYLIKGVAIGNTAAESTAAPAI